MTKAIRPFTAHTGSVGTATHSFLYGFIDNLSTLLFSTGSITASGTIACSNLSVANKAVSSIFAIMDGEDDLVYIDRDLAQFPKDLTVGRHAVITGDLEATTADILNTLQASNATITEIMQAGSVSSLGSLTAEGSSWLKGGLTVQGPASINTGGGLSASLTVNGPVSANSVSSGSSVSGLTGSFSTSATSPTFNGNLNGTASNATNASNAVNASWVPWSGVTSRPSTFPPSSHTHDVSEITGSIGVEVYSTSFYAGTITNTTANVTASDLYVPVSGRNILLMLNISGTLQYTASPNFNFVSFHVRTSTGTVIFADYSMYNYNGLGYSIQFAYSDSLLRYQSSPTTYRLRVYVSPGWVSFERGNLLAIVL